MKVVIGTTHMGDDLVEAVRRAYPAVTFAAAYTPEDQQREIVDADAFCGWPDREVFVAARRLRWLHVPGMGIDQIVKTPEVAASDVIITNAPGTHTNPIADHALAMMLALTHHMRELLDDQRAKRWDGEKYDGRKT